MIIPGQSLTAEPKNAPYENPPEINTEEGAVMWHLERLLEDDRLESLSDTLELGVDVVSLTEGLLRGAVLDGIHSIDISLVIAPVIHEFIASTAVKLGLDFEEGLPDDSKERTSIKYQINSRKARKMLDELDLEGDTDDVVEEESTQEELPMDMPKVSIGLMARPVGDML